MKKKKKKKYENGGTGWATSETQNGEMEKWRNGETEKDFSEIGKDITTNSYRATGELAFCFLLNR
jgi:hypothetical protein